MHSLAYLAAAITTLVCSVAGLPMPLDPLPYTGRSVREYHFTLTKEMAAPDGFTRQVLYVNNQYPGPLIEAYTGDTIRVHVKNQLDEPSAIHWHGMFQRGI